MSLKRWLTYSPVRVGSVLVLIFIAVLLAQLVARPATHTHAAPSSAVATPGTATLTADECRATGTVRLDTQAWFTAFAGQTGKDFGHTHVTVCYPVNKVISGSLTLTFLLTMHDNPGGTLDKIAIQIFGNYGAIVVAKQSFSPAYTCAMTCSWLITLTLDTTKVPCDGWQEMRIRPSVSESDGAKSVISTSYPIPLHNGKPVCDYRGALWQGKGWYDFPTNVQYAQSQYFSLIPIGPISAGWAPTVGCHSSSLPVTGCLVTIDPSFHDGNNGRILYQGNGTYKGRVVIPQLTPGLHTLVIRTDVRITATGSTNSGVLGISFYVP